MPRNIWYIIARWCLWTNGFICFWYEKLELFALWLLHSFETNIYFLFRPTKHDRICLSVMSTCCYCWSRPFMLEYVCVMSTWCHSWLMNDSQGQSGSIQAVQYWTSLMYTSFNRTSSCELYSSSTVLLSADFLKQCTHTNRHCALSCYKCCISSKQELLPVVPILNHPSETVFHLLLT